MLLLHLCTLFHVSIETAVDSADRDCEKLKQRTIDEDGDISMDMLQETHAATQDSIRDEKGELEMIKDQCDTDISTIGKAIYSY